MNWKIFIKKLLWSFIIAVFLATFASMLPYSFDIKNSQTMIPYNKETNIITTEKWLGNSSIWIWLLIPISLASVGFVLYKATHKEKEPQLYYDIYTHSVRPLKKKEIKK